MKKISLLLISFLLLLNLSACHGGAVVEEEYLVPEEFDESQNYEITFWAKNDTNINQVNAYKEAIAEFEELYPNITINMKLYTDYTRIYNDVITNISTNTTPNVCITYPDHIATYLTGNNTVQKLDNLLNNENYGLGGSKLKFECPRKDEIVNEFLNEGILNDAYYALPFMRSTEALYINKTYVEKLGYEIPEEITWDFIFEVSEAAMAKTEDGTYLVNGQTTLIPFIYKSTDNMMIQMLKQLGADYSNENGDILLFNDTTASILKEIGKHAKSGAFSTFKISSYPANFLNAGQCIFAIDSSAGSTWMGTDAPLVDIAEENIVEFETIVREIPQYDYDNPYMISQGPSICIFNKEDDNEVLASWLFAEYLLTNDVQLAYSETEGYVPVTYKALNSLEYEEYLSACGVDNDEHYYIKIEASQLLINNIENTFTTPVFNGSASLRTASGQLIERVCKDVKKNKEINDEYIAELYEDTNALYHLDQITGTTEKEEFGELPNESKILLLSLGVAWILIGVYAIHRKKKNLVDK